MTTTIIKGKNMKIDEIEHRLQAWGKLCGELDKQYDLYVVLTGAQPDSKMWSAIFAVMDAYTKAVGVAVGDNGEWMSYFQLDCNMGKTPRAVVMNDDTTFKMRTIKDLARVIAW